MEEWNTVVASVVEAEGCNGAPARGLMEQMPPLQLRPRCGAKETVKRKNFVFLGMVPLWNFGMAILSI